MDVEVRRWIVEAQDGSVGLACQARWIGPDGTVHAVAGPEPAPGTAFLDDDEFVEAVIDLDTRSKRRWDNEQAERQAYTALTIEEAEADRAALIAAGIPAEVAERMVVVPVPYTPVPYSRPAGWDQWLVDTYYLTDGMIAEIRSRLEG